MNISKLLKEKNAIYFKNNEFKTLVQQIQKEGELSFKKSINLDDDIEFNSYLIINIMLKTDVIIYRNNRLFVAKQEDALEEGYKIIPFSILSDRKSVEKEILTQEEKEYLANVIKPIRNKVLNIAKKENNLKSMEWIKIDLNDDQINLYYFEKDTQFKEMKLDKEYTLEELGL